MATSFHSTALRDAALSSGVATAGRTSSAVLTMPSSDGCMHRPLPREGDVCPDVPRVAAMPMTPPQTLHSVNMATQSDVDFNASPAGGAGQLPSATQLFIAACATPRRRNERLPVPETSPSAPTQLAAGVPATPQQLTEGLRRIGRHSLTPDDVEAVSGSPGRRNSVQVASPMSAPSASGAKMPVVAAESIRALLASGFGAASALEGLQLPRLEVINVADMRSCHRLTSRFAELDFLGACIVSGLSRGLELLCLALGEGGGVCLPLAQPLPSHLLATLRAWFCDSRKLCLTPDAKDLAGSLLRHGVDTSCALAEPRIALWLLNPDDKQHMTITDIAALLEIKAQASPAVASSGVSRFFGAGLCTVDVGSLGRLASAWTETVLAVPCAALLLRRVHEQGLSESFWQVETPFSVVLAWMEHFGIGCAPYDPLQTHSHLLYRISALQERARHVVGRLVQLSSSEDVGRALFEDLALPLPRGIHFQRKANGRIAYRSPLELLRRLAPCPLVDLVLEHRQLSHVSRRFESLLRSGGPPRLEPRCAGLGACSCCGSVLAAAEPTASETARPRPLARLRSEFVQTATATGRIATGAGSFPILSIENAFEMHEVLRPSLQEELAGGRQPEAGARVFVAVAAAAPPAPQQLRQGELHSVEEACCTEPFQGGDTSLAEYWISKGWTVYLDLAHSRQVRQVLVKHGTSLLTYPADRVWRLAAPVHMDDESAPKLIVNPRRLLAAEPGHILLSVDYSQLEVRIMAHFSQDARFVEILHGEGDIFRHAAAGWLRKPESEVTAEERGGAKRICYGLVYGIGIGRLASELGISKAQAQEFQDSFMREYSGIAAWVQACREAARQCGFVQTLHSRRRFLPALASRSHAQRAHAERQAVNSSCQASAADLVKTAMLGIHSRLKTMRRMEAGECRMIAKMLLQMHDELLFEVHESYLEVVREMVVAEMIGAGRGLRVPLQVKWRIGKTFGTLA